MKKVLKFKVLFAVILIVALFATMSACSDTEVSSTTNVTSSEVSDVSTSSEGVEAPVSSVDSTKPSSDKANDSSKAPAVSSGNSSKKPSSSKPAVTSKVVTAKTPAQIIVGKWHGSADMGPMFTEQGYAVEGPQMVSCDIEFTSNGVLYEVVDRSSLKIAYTNVFTALLNDSLEQNNLTKQQFEASIGKTFDEYVNELVQTSMDLVPKTIISAYKFKGNDLYVRDQNDTDFQKEQYSFSGENKLTIVDGGTPITYTRIK